MNFYSSNFVGWDISNGSPCRYIIYQLGADSYLELEVWRVYSKGIRRRRRSIRIRYKKLGSAWNCIETNFIHIKLYNLIMIMTGKIAAQNIQCERKVMICADFLPKCADLCWFSGVLIFADFSLFNCWFFTFSTWQRCIPDRKTDRLGNVTSWLDSQTECLDFQTDSLSRVSEHRYQQSRQLETHSKHLRISWHSNWTVSR